jgi:hypothetical protein
VNIYKTTLPQEGVVVMGEANGISKELEALIRISCRYLVLGNQKFRNVAATAIVLSEFRR